MSVFETYMLLVFPEVRYWGIVLAIGWTTLAFVALVCHVIDKSDWDEKYDVGRVMLWAMFIFACLDF